MSPDVRLFTARGCHLCEPARDVLRDVCGASFTVVDITGDADLERRYRTRIPVVEIDGVEWFRYEVDAEALRAALRRRAGAVDASG